MKDGLAAGASTRDGFALATTLLIILVLGVIAVGASWLSSAERKTSFAGSVHTTALYSADGGGEAGINFLRLSDTPPPISDFDTRQVHTVEAITISGSQQYSFVCTYQSKRLKAGWGTEYLDYDYSVTADGRSAQEGRSAVQLVARRLYREGY